MKLGKKIWDGNTIYNYKAQVSVYLGSHKLYAENK